MRKRARMPCWGLEDGARTLGAGSHGSPPRTPVMGQDGGRPVGPGWCGAQGGALRCHLGAGRGSWRTPFAVPSQSEVMAGPGVPEGNVGPGRSAPVSVPVLTRQGRETPQVSTPTVHLPPKVAACHTCFLLQLVPMVQLDRPLLRNGLAPGLSPGGCPKDGPFPFS